MKEITNIIHKGVHYVDDDGNPQFIDFETCQQNNVLAKKAWRETVWTDDDEVFWQKTKYVGLRVTFREPPAIEFYTKPRTFFEFQTRDDLWEIVSKIKEVGWRINDGD